MAIVQTNLIVNGFSGMLGKTIVFKNLRGKTVIASRPASPKKQSEQQRANRSKFKQASHWAKCMMLDPVKKAYYQKKAHKLNLPNAYTAAIADYMRKPKIREIERTSDQATYFISKKDFDVKKVEIKFGNANGEVKETHLLNRNKINEWIFTLQLEELLWGTYVTITDQAGNFTSFNLTS